MNTRFLRDEAARFRGMAEEADREASRLRFLAMAADYEARATAADGLTTLPPMAKIAPALIEPNEVETVKSMAVSKLTLGLKDTALVGRRPVGRPRLKMAAPGDPPMVEG